MFDMNCCCFVEFFHGSKMKFVLNDLSFKKNKKNPFIIMISYSQFSSEGHVFLNGSQLEQGVVIRSTGCNVLVIVDIKFLGLSRIAFAFGILAMFLHCLLILILISLGPP